MLSGLGVALFAGWGIGLQKSRERPMDLPQPITIGVPPPSEHYWIDATYHQRVLYILAEPNSDKFNQQLRLLSSDTKPLDDLHILVVPISYGFATMGWPSGINIQHVNNIVASRVRKRVGWREGQQEFIVALIDRNGKMKLQSHDPVPIDRLQRALAAPSYR